jgi:hypothetical protein
MVIAFIKPVRQQPRRVEGIRRVIVIGLGRYSFWSNVMQAKGADLG